MLYITITIKTSNTNMTLKYFKYSRGRQNYKNTDILFDGSYYK